MKNRNSRLFDAIPASKYYPPELHPERHVGRQRLINTLHHRQIDRKKIILVEAQAGQGKSVFSAQLMQGLNAPFIWYQLGHEDGALPDFVSGLLCALSRRFTGFSAPLLEKILASGEAVITSYSIHYTKLYDRDRGTDGNLTVGKRPAVSRRGAVGV